MSLTREARKAIEEEVRRRFDTFGIVDIDVKEDENHDGDPSLFVRIVLDAEIKDVDASRLVSITRHLQDRLWGLGEDRFPYTRLLSKEDFEGLAT